MVANVLPWAAYAMLRTGNWPAGNGKRVSVQVEGSQNLTAPLSFAVASVLPSGAKATAP